MYNDRTNPLLQARRKEKNVAIYIHEEHSRESGVWVLTIYNFISIKIDTTLRDTMFPLLCEFSLYYLGALGSAALAVCGL